MRTRGARPTTPGWLGMADVRTSVLWRRIQPPRATPRSTDRRPPWSSCRARAATEQLLSWAIGRGSDSKARLPLLTPVFLLPVQFVSSLLTKLGSCPRRGSLVRTTRATGDLSPFARCAQAGRVAITARGQTGGLRRVTTSAGPAGTVVGKSPHHMRSHEVSDDLVIVHVQRGRRCTEQREQHPCEPLACGWHVEVLTHLTG